MPSSVPSAPSRDQKRERVLTALALSPVLGPLRDHAWHASVPYSTLRRWVRAVPTLAARFALARKPPR